MTTLHKENSETTTAVQNGFHGFRQWISCWGGKFTLVYGFLVLAHIVYVLFQPGGEEYVPLISNIATIVIYFGPFLMAWRVSRHKDLAPRTRRAWRLVALAYLAFVAGSVLWLYFENIQGTQPFPSWADAGFLTYYPLMLLGLLSLVSRLESAEERIKFGLDACIVMVAAGMILWYFLLKPIADANTGDDLTLILSLAYPIGDLVLLFGIITVILRHSSLMSSWPTRFLIGGLILNFIADFTFSYQSVQGTFQPASFVDTLFTISCFPVMLGAHYQYRKAASEQDLAATTTFGTERGYVIWLPYCAIALAYAMILNLVFRESDSVLGQLIIMAAILTALVILRQVVAMREIAKANIAIGELQERVQGIYAASADAIGFARFDGTLTDVNEALVALTGYTKSELLGGMSYDDLTAPESRTSNRGNPKSTISSGLPSECEKNFLRKDGTRTAVLVTEYMVKGRNGDSIGLASVVRDITERKRAEAERDVISEIIQGVATTANLNELLQLIHRSIGRVLNADNCYVALYDSQTELLHSPFFIDKFDTAAPPTKLGKGLTAYVLRKGKAMLLTVHDIQVLTEKGEISTIGTTPALWLGVPLRTPEGIIGALVVQHYEDENAYNIRDLEFLSSVGDQIALAIERKENEKALNASQELYRDLVENAIDIIYTHDLKGNYTSVNRAGERITGYTREEALTMSLDDIVTPEYRQKAALMIEAKMADENVPPYDIEIRAKDGGNVALEINTRILYQNGLPVAVHGIARDITERKQAERALRENEEKFRELVENANDVIYTLDLAGNFTSLNRAGETLTGYSREEAVQKSITDVIAPENAASVLARFALNKAGSPQPNIEMEIIAKDGRKLTIDVSSRMIIQDGVPVGLQGIGRDITESLKTRKELERFNEKLQQSNRELQDFAYVASHDLQEPLRKVQAFSDRLRTKYADKLEGDGLDYLERMRSAANRMQMLIQDLLTFSRVSTKAQPFVSVDLETITREVLSDLEVKIEETGATVELKDLSTIDADPMQMRQLMQNLIGNALKFQQKGMSPVISIHGQQIVSNGDGTNGHVQISVKDNGIGFDEKYVDKIFAVFQRLHGRTEYEGSGVGLSICRKIAERHNGNITAHSLPGAGSTFVVTLPLTQVFAGVNE